MIFHEKFSSSDRKMDFCLTTSASTLPRFQITWLSLQPIQAQQYCSCNIIDNYVGSLWAAKHCSNLLHSRLIIFDLVPSRALSHILRSKIIHSVTAVYVCLIYMALSVQILSHHYNCSSDNYLTKKG